MTTTPTILVSITDPVLHPEAINIAAATGMDIIDTSDPRDIVRHAPKAAAILVDATTATHAGGIHPRRLQRQIDDRYKRDGEHGGDDDFRQRPPPRVVGLVPGREKILSRVRHCGENSFG